MSKDVITNLDTGEVYVDSSASPGEWPDCPNCGGELVSPDIESYEGEVYCGSCGQSVSLEIRIIGYTYLPGNTHPEFEEEHNETV